MQIHKYKKGEAQNIGECVLALGLFDGVHLGHRALIERAVSLAEKNGIPAAVFTFNSDSVGPKGKERLYSSKIKAELLAELGIEHIFEAEFDGLSDMSAEDFIKETLLSDLRCKIALTGKDFRFGKGRAGDTELLSKLFFENGADFITVDDVPDGDKKISSAGIKELFKAGEVRHASRLLGKPYFIENTVTRGLGLGKELGTPTVNISLQNSLAFLKSGVYASLVKINDEFYTGLTNIGTCPTFGARERHSETYILDFSGELYGEKLRVYLIDYLREEKKFPSAKALSDAIAEDARKTKAIMKDISLTL